MKELQPGNFRDRVTIRKEVNARDSEGHILKVPYSDRCTVWANIYDKGSNAVNSSDELIHSVITEITIRYRNDILQTDLIVDTVHGRTFEQVAPPIILDTRRFLQMSCREVIKSNG
jgi:head-tail adaptor